MTTTMAQPGLAPDINLFEAMDIFKNFPDEELPKYRNDPKLALVAAAEMDRRLRIRKDFESRSQKPSGPVVDQIQQQLLAPPQGIAQGMDQQPMGQPMGQPQEMQQPQPAIGMASGGPVAFSGGGDPDEERKKRDREAISDSLKSLGASAMDVLTLPGRGALGAAEFAITRPLRALGLNVPYLPEAVYGGDRSSMTPFYDQLRRERGETSPAPTAPANALTQQTGDPGKTSQGALIAAILAGRQPTSSAVAAPAPTLGGLAKIAKDYIPEINPPMSPEEKRKIEDEEAARYQQRFPDKVSPIMEEMARAAGQQVSPEEARRRAFMKAGIAGLGYTGRDFGAGVAGMLEGYQGTKESIEAANKEAKMNELKARLAGEQYKDALKRKDFESARKYAEEQAIYKEKAVDARNQYKRDTLGIMAAVQGLTKPSKVGGASEAKGAMTASKLADIREKAIERAQPELQRLDSEFDKRAEEWFFSSTKLPKAWRTGSDEKSVKAQEEYAERRKRILDKYTNEVLDVFRAANPLVITKEQAQAIASGKK
jgi:hypothetical protein